MRTQQTKTSIGICNGDFFDYRHPEIHDYDIRAIAQSLSKICRYNGHNDGDKHYSVAEHSVLVSRIVPEKYALEGLMHDASEAYTGDIQKPLKEMLNNFKKIEDRIEKCIAAHFGLRFPYPPEIKLADRMLYNAERQQVATSVHDGIWNQGIEPADVKIECWGIKRAREAFLTRFYELSNDEQEYRTIRRKAA